MAVRLYKGGTAGNKDGEPISNGDMSNPITFDGYDIETGDVEADSITEEGVTYYIAGFCDDDSGVEYPVDFGIEKIEKSLTKEERELLQAFAEKNSGFIDEDIIDKAMEYI